MHIKSICNIKSCCILFIAVLLFLSGCLEQTPAGTPLPEGTPAVSVTPTAAPTVIPTIIPTTPAPTPVLTTAPTPILTPERTSKTYYSFVDESYGFRSVRLANGDGSTNYTNHTLIINAGDTVIWESWTVYNYPLTVVSREGLWDNSSGEMRYQYSKFNYTFNRSGTYEVYLKDFPKVAPQKIIVNP